MRLLRAVAAIGRSAECRLVASAGAGCHTEPVGLRAQLWRGIAAFRFASLSYAAVLLVVDRGDYQRPVLAWLVLGGMTAWTAATSCAYAVPARRTRAPLAADLAVTAAALLSTLVLQRAGEGAAMPVTATWAAGPVLAWAVAYGRRAGMTAAVILGLCDIARHRPISGAYHISALNGPILMLLAGWVVGYVSRLAVQAEQAVQQAAEIEAASRERERIARGIHDSVLQVLALVHRRGIEAGGEAAEIGRLAGEQEAALRALIAAGRTEPLPPGELDLRTLLGSESSADVSVITPAGPVRLASTAAQETALAVRAALDNVRQHCGPAAKAWVLVEDEGNQVTVTVRDDGPGIPDGRLAQAAMDGRLGVSQAIRGRVRDLGGTVSISSAPGTGTEVRLHIPRLPEGVPRDTSMMTT
jgi:signal transduction histidine kinase